MIIAVNPNGEQNFAAIWSQLECFADKIDKIIIAAPIGFKDKIGKFIEQVKLNLPGIGSRRGAPEVLYRRLFTFQLNGASPVREHHRAHFLVFATIWSRNVYNYIPRSYIQVIDRLLVSVLEGLVDLLNDFTTILRAFISHYAAQWLISESIQSQTLHCGDLATNDSLNLDKRLKFLAELWDHILFAFHIICAVIQNFQYLQLFPQAFF